MTKFLMTTEHTSQFYITYQEATSWKHRGFL